MKRPKVTDFTETIYRADAYKYTQEQEKYIDYLEAENKKLRLCGVMPMLLCVDSKNASNLTKDKKYTPMSIGNHVYKLIDDNNNVVHLAKPRFKIIEAQ